MNSPAARPSWLDAGLVTIAKAGATALVLLFGFRAISDDDYARVVIAQRFAEQPALDPTGSSWLPLPFYVYGTALRVFGSSLAVAQGVAVALGLLSALVIWYAARLLGLVPWTALVAALVAAILPYSAYLGAATVPEAPTAALMVLGAAALGVDSSWRLLGAAALFAATASRYEAWAVALVFAIVSAWDGLRRKDRRLVLAGVVAAAFPLLWLLHGAVRHGDPFFFVARVTDYRRALGPEEALSARLLRTPLASITGEPELMLVTAAVVAPALLASARSVRLTRLALALLAVPLLSWLGDLRGSAPTHHGERALLAVWWGAALALGWALQTAHEWSRGRRIAVVVGALVGFVLGAVLRLSHPRAPFVDRRLAAEIGERARAARIEQVAIDAPDYAYFAVQAGFGRPTHSWVLDDHDPRKPRLPDLLAGSPAKLTRELADHGIRWLVLPRFRVPLARTIVSASEGNSEWTLLKLSSD